MDSEDSKLLLLLSPNFNMLNLSLQEEIFRDFYNLNYGSIMYMINDHGAAEDIIQEAFLKTLRKGPPIADGEQIKAWIKVVVRNATINYLRKNNKVRHETDLDSVFINEEHSSDVESVETQVEAKLLEELIFRHLKEMKNDYRLLIELKWKKQLSYKEIAQELNSTENTVRQKFHRAREALKKKMNLKQETPDE
jgi:RNA polymerase sigma-70 factor, ECF subfamily